MGRLDISAAEIERIEQEDSIVADSIPELLGHTMVAVERLDFDDSASELIFCRSDGKRFRFYYQTDCCASCYIEDICGDLPDLVGHPLVKARVVSNYERDAPDGAESYTWTFYRFSTVKGTVTVRWLGESNGYYSEEVSFGPAR